MLENGPRHMEFTDFAQIIPRSIASLRTEANVPFIVPWFAKSLSVPGDVCEFGCFRGTLSIKMAFALKCLGHDNKRVYAFDTFEGFKVADPSGGALGKGAYGDNDNSYEELTKWSSAVPVTPVKGDATTTCETLTKSLSFVWLDLDFEIFMRPVLEKIWPLITPETVIGIDDVGRPETPSVEPWVDEVVSSGRLIELQRYSGDFIRFFRAKK